MSAANICTLAASSACFLLVVVHSVDSHTCCQLQVAATLHTVLMCIDIAFICHGLLYCAGVCDCQR